MDLFDRPVFPVLNKNFRLEDAVTERSRSHDFGANGELAIGSSGFCLAGLPALPGLVPCKCLASAWAKW